MNKIKRCCVRCGAASENWFCKKCQNELMEKSSADIRFLLDGKKRMETSRETIRHGDELYLGEIRYGVKHGKGWYYHRTLGDIYYGSFVNDERSGVGSYYNLNSKLYYTGKWKHGLKSGTGFSQVDAVSFYEGEYLGDDFCGYGSFFGFDPQTGETFAYRGDWFVGKKEGIGRFYLRGGQYYIGEMSNDVASGLGRMYYPNGTMYFGEFREGNPHGHGVFQGTKETYVGEFKRFVYDGHGTYYYADGSQVTGMMKSDKFDGPAIHYYPDGTCRTEVYDMNRLVSAGERRRI